MSNKKPQNFSLLTYSNWNGVGSYSMWDFVREFHDEDVHIYWDLREWLYE
jgi:hypothetical protein